MTRPSKRNIKLFKKKISTRFPSIEEFKCLLYCYFKSLHFMLRLEEEETFCDFNIPQKHL